MNGDSFTPEERAIIERLSNAPQSDLSTEAFSAIRARMLAAADSPPGLNPVPHTRPPISMAAILGTVAAVVGIVVVVITALNGGQSDEIPLAAPSETSTPTATVIPSATPFITTDTPVPTETIATSESVPQLVPDTATPTLSATATDLVVPTSTLESVIVVEGPVQEINENIVVIFGIQIYFDPEHPLLDVIEVGDILHIAATYDSQTSIIVAVNVAQITQEINPPPPGFTDGNSEINPESGINVNPETGEVWQDNGNCDNPPPPWAPANGWRRRCEGSSGDFPSGNADGNSSSGNRNNGNGNGNGNNNGNPGKGP